MALRPAEGAERAGGDARSAAGAVPEHGERRGQRCGAGAESRRWRGPAPASLWAAGGRWRAG